jgi:hypothetical protein
MTTRERLDCGARMLDSIDAQRQSRSDPKIFAAVENKIVDCELKELEAEWRANSEISVALPVSQISAWRRRP